MGEPATTGLMRPTAFPLDVTDLTTMMTSNVTDYNASSQNVTPDYACHSVKDPNTIVSLKIYIFSSLVFVVVGLVGNTLSVVVFSSKEMRIVSSNVYLLTLAVSDTLYLICCFLTKILNTLRCMYFKESLADISNRNPFACILLQYMSDLFSDYSACLILAFTVERYIACYHPIKFKDICTVKRSKLACLAILLVIAVFICPYHIMYIGHYKGYEVCTVLMDFEAEFTILYVVEALLFRIGPVIDIAVLNVFIIAKVSKVHAERRKRHAATRLQNNNKKNTQQDRHMQLTVMLILVSSTYIILYLPVLVHFVLWKLKRSSIIDMSDVVMDNIQNYTRALYISGFAINFFLYTMSGKVFRDQLELILCDARLKQEHKQAQETTDEKQTLV